MSVTMSCILVAVFVACVSGNGRLLVPPQRSSLWRLPEYYMNRFVFKNYDDHTLDCGGYWKKHENNGRCGVCGDPWDAPEPRPNEAGGIYARGIIGHTYPTDKRYIDSVIQVTSSMGGYFEFHICPNNNVHKRVDQECLDKYPLQVLSKDRTTSYGRRFYPDILAGRGGIVELSLEIPEGLECTQCVLQWRWHGANNYGICRNGRWGKGCGEQPEIVNCADIAILPEERIKLETQKRTLIPWRAPNKRTIVTVTRQTSTQKPRVPVTERFTSVAPVTPLTSTGATESNTRLEGTRSTERQTLTLPDVVTIINDTPSNDSPLPDVATNEPMRESLTNQQYTFTTKTVSHMLSSTESRPILVKSDITTPSNSGNENVSWIDFSSTSTMSQPPSDIAANIISTTERPELQPASDALMAESGTIRDAIQKSNVATSIGPMVWMSSPTTYMSQRTSPSVLILKTRSEDGLVTDVTELTTGAALSNAETTLPSNIFGQAMNSSTPIALPLVQDNVSVVDLSTISGTSDGSEVSRVATTSITSDRLSRKTAGQGERTQTLDNGTEQSTVQQLVSSASPFISGPVLAEVSGKETVVTSIDRSLTQHNGSISRTSTDGNYLNIIGGQPELTSGTSLSANTVQPVTIPDATKTLNHEVADISIIGDTLTTVRSDHNFSNSNGVFVDTKQTTKASFQLATDGNQETHTTILDGNMDIPEYSTKTIERKIPHRLTTGIVYTTTEASDQAKTRRSATSSIKSMETGFTNRFFSTDQTTNGATSVYKPKTSKAFKLVTETPGLTSTMSDISNTNSPTFQILGNTDKASENQMSEAMPTSQSTTSPNKVVLFLDGMLDKEAKQILQLSDSGDNQLRSSLLSKLQTDLANQYDNLSNNYSVNLSDKSSISVKNKSSELFTHGQLGGNATSSRNISTDVYTVEQLFNVLADLERLRLQFVKSEISDKPLSAEPTSTIKLTETNVLVGDASNLETIENRANVSKSPVHNYTQDNTADVTHESNIRYILTTVKSPLPASSLFPGVTLWNSTQRVESRENVARGIRPIVHSTTSRRLQTDIVPITEMPKLLTRNKSNAMTTTNLLHPVTEANINSGRTTNIVNMNTFRHPKISTERPQLFAGRKSEDLPANNLFPSVNDMNINSAGTTERFNFDTFRLGRIIRWID